MCRYCLAVILIQQQTWQFDLDGYSAVPRAVDANSPGWEGLTDLVRSLIRQNRWSELPLLVRQQCSYKPPQERPALLQFYIKACQDAIATASHDVSQLRWLEGLARIQLAQAWLACEETTKVDKELTRAETVLRKCPDFRNIKTYRHTPTFIDIQLLRQEMIPPQDLKARWRGIERLIKVSHEARSYLRIDAVYHEAQEVSHALFQIDTSNSQRHLQCYLDIYRRHKEIQTKITGNRQGLLSDHGSLIVHGVDNPADLPRALEWYEDFERMYPDFDLPKENYRKESLKSLAYQILGDQAGSDRAQRAMANWKPQTQPPIQIKQQNPSFLPCNVDQYVEAWIEAVDEGIERVNWIMRVLRDLMTDDVVHATSHCENLARIFLPQDVDVALAASSCIHNQITSLTDEDMFRQLYGPKGQPVDDSIWNARLAFFERWLRPFHTNRSACQHVYILLRKQRVTTLLDADFETREDLVTMLSSATYEAQACLDAFPKLLPSVKQLTASVPLSLRQQMAHSQLLMAKCSGEALNSKVNRKRIRYAYGLLERALAENKPEFPEQSPRVVDVHAEIARICWLRRLSGTLTAADCKKLALKHLQHARAIQNTSRLGLHLPKGRVDPLDALYKMEQLGETQRGWSLSQIAVQILRFSTDGNHIELWDWVQQAKARALSGLLGIGLSLSQTVPVQSGLDDESQRLIDEEEHCLSKIRTAGPNELFQLRHDLQRIHNQMRQQEELRDLMDLRDGAPLTLKNLDEIAHHGGHEDHLVFVDWVYAKPLGLDDQHDLFVMVVRPGLHRDGHVDIQFRPLEINLERVDEWLEQYLRRPNPKSRAVAAKGRPKMSQAEAAKHFLPEMDELVAPLGELTAPGETLILCPTQALHQVPLSALRVDGEILIQRNPLVYCHSLSILRYCLKSAIHSNHASLGRPPVALFAGPDWPTMPNRLVHGREVVQELSAEFGVTPFLDRAATKQKFADELATCRLVHFHGHAPVTDNPLEHRILLHRPLSDTHVDSHDQCIAARDLFSLRVRRGAHVTLIACQSGRHWLSAGDEAKGLVPALFFSGASSAISTLWDVPDRVGAHFARHFYAAWAHHRVNQPPGAKPVVDLARAFQSAVLALARDPSLLSKASRTNDTMMSSISSTGVIPPYYWATFLLHGWWLMNFPPGRASPDQTARSTREGRLQTGNQSVG